MKARHVARELAFILFSQLETYEKKISKKDFENILLDSVRILTNSANEELQLSLKYLFETKEFIKNYENDHPKNTSRPIDSNNIPVKIPMTDDMVKRIDEIIEVSEKTLMALEIAEMTTIEEKSDVKDFVLDIAETYVKNKIEVDELISKHTSGWDIDRLVKMDKDILRIAICEMVYLKPQPTKVIINEAIELAKKYSTDDSSSFINGILAKVAEEYGIKK